MIVPALLADTDYDRDAPPANNAPAIPGLFLRGGGSLALVDSGKKLPVTCCDTLLNRDQWPAFPVDKPSRQDLLLFLPASTNEKLTHLSVEVAGQSGLQVGLIQDAIRNLPDRLETRAYPRDQGPLDGNGHHIESGWIARIPIVFTPTHAWDIGGVRYPIDVTATYQVQDDPHPHTLVARAAIQAQVADALAEMSIAAAALPLMCLVAAFRRWRKTR